MQLKYLSLLFILLVPILVSAQILDGYYASAEDLSGDNLKSALHNIIKNHKEFTYTSSTTDTWDILKESDKDTANPSNVILFYSGWSVNAEQEYNNAKGWSREHVWAKSHGDFGIDLGAGTDAHHLRPTDISVNSARSNKDFDFGGDLYVDGDGMTACRSDNDSWQPRDAVKGDVARMLFYMAVRYEGLNAEPDLEILDQVDTYDLNENGKGFHGKLSTLIEWHKQDPVDSFEINRNNVIYSYQGNRNPFIDHPEYVELIWNTTGSELLNQKGISVYPNPVKDFLQIELLNNTEATGSIISITGRKVAEFIGRGRFKVQTDGIDSGLYLVSLVSEAIRYQTKLVIRK